MTSFIGLWIKVLVVCSRKWPYLDKRAELGRKSWLDLTWLLYRLFHSKWNNDLKNVDHAVEEVLKLNSHKLSLKLTYNQTNFLNQCRIMGTSTLASLSLRLIEMSEVRGRGPFTSINCDHDLPWTGVLFEFCGWRTRDKHVKNKLGLTPVLSVQWREAGTRLGPLSHPDASLYCSKSWGVIALWRATWGRCLLKLGLMITMWAHESRSARLRSAKMTPHCSPTL